MSRLHPSYPRYLSFTSAMFVVGVCFAPQLFAKHVYQGCVVNGLGERLSGVAITAYQLTKVAGDWKRHNLASTKTDRRGVYQLSISIAPEDVTLEFEKTGFPKLGASAGSASYYSGERCFVLQRYYSLNQVERLRELSGQERRNALRTILAGRPSTDESNPLTEVSLYFSLGASLVDDLRTITKEAALQEKATHWLSVLDPSYPAKHSYKRGETIVADSFDEAISRLGALMSENQAKARFSELRRIPREEDGAVLLNSMTKCNTRDERLPRVLSS
ncbi:MAG TPA: hypothetical protein VN418_01390 [Gammaproteobacteria bacterium]|nr:hypothetical protein [Gammaproteobacteria bacterium]